MWKNVTAAQWKNWQWQLENSIEDPVTLSKIIPLTDDEINEIKNASDYFRMKISPFIANMMSQGKTDNSLKLQFIPSSKEIESINDSKLYTDVNADSRNSPVKGLVHRYPTKVLVFPSNFCGCYCRYCFRRKLKRDKEELLSSEDFEKILDYIKQHPQITEVIFSGGDPLVVSDEIISCLLDKISNIEHVKIVRFHTRMPITIPYRITDSLIDILSRYKKRFAVYFVLHIDTLNEFSLEAKNAVSKLADNGIMCFASCPLLKNINDDEISLFNLWTTLAENRVKPYYLFHPEPVKGTRHFIVPLSRGLDIIKNTYNRMSGLAMPLYCFSVPDGGGNALVTYPYIEKTGENKYKLTNFEGEVTEYIDFE